MRVVALAMLLPRALGFGRFVRAGTLSTSRALPRAAVATTALPEVDFAASASTPATWTGDLLVLPLHAPPKGDVKVDQMHST